MKRAIIYGRTSTSKQSVESIETQIAECQKWANENNCTIVEIYDDSGQSGRSYNVSNRDGFQQIKVDAMNGRMDYALIHKIDRFARSVADYFIQERSLENYGVKVIVVGMPFFQDADIITKSVHIAMAEQFSKNLSEDVSVKMRTFARKGAFLGGKPPYGFNVETSANNEKHLVINEAEAIAIRLAYESYLQGYGYEQTARILAENGFLSYTGNQFTAMFIKKILFSKKYNGYYVYGERNNINGKEKRVADKSLIIEIPDAVEKIIDDATFQAVQNKMKNTNPRNKRHKRDYPLTGLIVCGVCGYSYVGSCTTKNGQLKFPYYKCSGRKIKVCTSKSIRAEILENYILKKIKEYLFDDSFTDQLISEVEKNLSGDVQHFHEIRKKIEKELKSINGEIKEATREKYKKKISEDLYNEIVDDLNKEKNSLEIRLYNINSQIDVENKTDEIAKYVKLLKENFENSNDEIKSVFLRQIVQSIKVNDETIEVLLNITQGTDAKGFSDSLHNISGGVPLFTLGKQKISIYIKDGFNCLTFSINKIHFKTLY